MTPHSHIFGIHAVLAALKAKVPIETLLILKDKQNHNFQEIIDIARAEQLEIRFTARNILDHYGKAHQGVVALLIHDTSNTQFAPDLDKIINNSLNARRLILALDGVTDPHNLGACIRSAEALGADALIIPKDKSAQVTATTHKTSAGASHILPVLSVINLSESLKKLTNAGFWIVGLDGEAEQNITEIDFLPPTVLVLGNEGSGLRRLTKEHCDFLARIPMHGQTESLNVSVACGISLFEINRQRTI